MIASRFNAKALHRICPKYLHNIFDIRIVKISNYLMAMTPKKKTKSLYQTSLNLPLEALRKLEKLEEIETDTAEIKRRGAIREIEKEYKKNFGKSAS